MYMIHSIIPSTKIWPPPLILHAPTRCQGMKMCILQTELLSVKNAVMDLAYRHVCILCMYVCMNAYSRWTRTRTSTRTQSNIGMYTMYMYRATNLIESIGLTRSVFVLPHGKKKRTDKQLAIHPSRRHSTAFLCPTQRAQRNVHKNTQTIDV